MQVHDLGEGADLIVGDCRDAMGALDECSVDAIVTDPPYDLGFMNKGWDKTRIAFDARTWQSALRAGSRLRSFLEAFDVTEQEFNAAADRLAAYGEHWTPEIVLIGALFVRMKTSGASFSVVRRRG